MTSWDEYFIAMAKLVASKSKDPNTKIGAVIVNDGCAVISTGYNSFPRGLDDNVPERQERPEKYFWIEHAERNAIYQAARHGSQTLGCAIYLSCWIPCTGCAKAIINSGIKEVVLGESCNTASNRWLEEGAKSKQMFKECGVTMRYAEGV